MEGKGFAPITSSDFGAHLLSGSGRIYFAFEDADLYCADALITELRNIIPRKMEIRVKFFIGYFFNKLKKLIDQNNVSVIKSNEDGLIPSEWLVVSWRTGELANWR
jgi:hypothetical protein